MLLMKVTLFKVCHYTLLHQVFCLLYFSLRNVSVIVLRIFLKFENLEVGTFISGALSDHEDKRGCIIFQEGNESYPLI